MAVIALEAPAGYGRSVLVDQALAEGPRHPGDCDILYRCVSGDAAPDVLAAHLVEVCAGTSRQPPAGSGGSVGDIVADALESAVPLGHHVALVIDALELAGSAGAGLVARLAADLPAGAHLVLSGRRLPRVGLPRMVASGRAVLLGAAELAFRPDEVDQLVEGMSIAADVQFAEWPVMVGLERAGHAELAVDYVRDEIVARADPLVIRALAAVAAVDGCTDRQLGPVLAAVGIESVDAVEDIRDELALLPLGGGHGGCWPDPIWVEATRGVLVGTDRDLACVAKTRCLVATGALSEAGSMSLRTRNPAALAEVVRAALSSQPPLATFDDLRSWATSGVLGPGSPEGRWLAATVDLQNGDTDARTIDCLEEVRRSFEATGDSAGETALLLHLGHVARAGDDIATLGRVLLRGEELAALGQPAAAALVCLGTAVAAQLSGDSAAALAALDKIPPGSLAGDWAAQSLMIRGTNLLLSGRIHAAVVALESATGEGSEASRAVAFDLLATARWYAEDPLGALIDAESAEHLAVRADVPGLIQRIRATRACFLAASGRYAPARALLDQVERRGGPVQSDEAAALCRVADALLLADAGDLVDARRIVASIAVTGRAVRTSLWTSALATALGLEPEVGADVDAAIRADAGLTRARAAGRAAAAHLAGGPPADAAHRPYLPARWCTSHSPVVTISLLGTGTVHRGVRLVDHPAWGRSRVRELCLHLALVDDRSREGVAAAIWPDLEDRAAGRNLRVTLTHLLDVLDPDRERSQGSRVVADRAGSLSFTRGGGLHIDLWDLEDQASAIVATPEPDRTVLLALGRQLAGSGTGSLLGGSPVGEWLEPHRRRLNDLVIAAALTAGDRALAAGDPRLAEALAHRALATDPWSERAQRVVVEARLTLGDHDGARRAAEHTLAVLADLGVTPAADTAALLRRVGSVPARRATA